ncbi:hypothetical protein M405DRAFT_213243 [Rhizopogon salebrosus TDB-379]|nr:hypothetical protein M405DRAFT_213243 [Rhizopogon salebrosus TDB-379]
MYRYAVFMQSMQAYAAPLWFGVYHMTLISFSLTYIPGQGMNRTLMEVSILDHSRYRGRVEET